MRNRFSETECKRLTKEYRPKINRERINWGSLLAGLIDSDGHISKIPQLVISYNEVDVSVAYYIKNKIGYGVVRKVKGKNAWVYVLGKREGLERVGGMIRGKLRHEEKIRQYNERLKYGLTKKGEGSILKDNWLAGFVMGDGSFQIKILKRRDREEVRLEIQIDQKKDEILKEIKEEIGGNIYYREKQGTYYYSSTSMKVAKN